MRAPGSSLAGRLAAFALVAIAAAVLAAGCGSTPGPAPTPLGPAAPPSAGSVAPAVGTTTATPIASPTTSPTTSPSLAAATATPGVTPAGPTPVFGEETVTKRAADGSWTFSFRRPVVSGVGRAAAARMNDRIGALVAQYESEFANDVPPAGSGTSTFVGSFSIAYASPALLSIRFAADRSISVAAHPDHIVGGLNFAVATGKAIGLTDLFSDQVAALQTISTESRDWLRAELPGSEQDQLAAGTEPRASNFDAAWAITEGGLEITFPEYAVGPYAVGTPVVVVPWSALAPALAAGGPAAAFRT